MRFLTLASSFLLTAVVLFSPAAQADSAFLLQLGSFPSRNEAMASWQAMQSKHASILGQIDAAINPVPVGDGNSIFRLQAGPLASSKAADEACGKLRAADQKCFVVETAVLHPSVPSQALRAVRAKDTSVSATEELGLGASATATDGLMRLDTSLPRASAAAAVKQVEAAAVPAVAAPAIAPAIKAETEELAALARTIEPEAAAPLALTSKPVSATPPVTDAAAVVEPLVLPSQRAAALKGPSIPLNTAPAEASAVMLAPTKTVTPAPQERLMGSLGTLKLDKNGNVVGVTRTNAPTTLVASTTPDARPPLVLPGSPLAKALEVQNQQKTTTMATTAVAEARNPQTVAMLAPPSPMPSAGRVRDTQGTLGAAPPAGYSPEQLRPTTAPDAVVQISEAVPVDAPPTTAPVAASSAPSAPAAAPSFFDRITRPIEMLMPSALTGPDSWRGKPTQAAPAGTQWAQLGAFKTEAEAYAYAEELRRSNPAALSGVRVRTVQSMGVSPYAASVLLRVGPYRSTEEINAICALADGKSCSAAPDGGLSGSQGWGKNTRRNRATASPLLTPQATGSTPTGQGFIGGRLMNPTTPLVSGTASGIWAHVGSFAHVADASARLMQVQPVISGEFSNLSTVVVPSTAIGSARSYHARVGSFADRNAALGFCASVAARGINCTLLGN